MTAAGDPRAEAAARNDELIHPALIRAWLAWGLGWLLIFPTIGAIVAAQFNHPELLDGVPWLSFGRLRPIHVNGVIWGAFSTLFIVNPLSGQALMSLFSTHPPLEQRVARLRAMKI